MFQFQNLRCHRLAQVENWTTSEITEVDLLCHILTNLIVLIDFLSIAQADLSIGIFHLIVSNYHSVSVDFKVAILWVYNHIKIFIRSILLLQHVVEWILNNTDQSCTVNVLCLLKLLKGVNETDLLFVFLCHFIVYFSIIKTELPPLPTSPRHTWIPLSPLLGLGVSFLPPSVSPENRV